MNKFLKTYRGAPDLEFLNLTEAGFAGLGHKFRPDLE